MKPDSPSYTPEEWAALTDKFIERSDKAKQQRLWDAIANEDLHQAAHQLVAAVVDGARINVPEPRQGYRVLHVLAQQRRWPLVAMAVAWGAYPYIWDNVGREPVDLPNGDKESREKFKAAVMEGLDFQDEMQEISRKHESLAKNPNGDTLAQLNVDRFPLISLLMFSNPS